MKQLSKKEKDLLIDCFTDQDLITFRNIKQCLEDMPDDGIILLVKDAKGKIMYNDTFTQRQLNIKAKV